MNSEFENSDFEIISQDREARSAIFKTAYGDIKTPAFMPVGTVGSVKAMLPEQVSQTGADIILGNTYHLMLRPTAERIAEFGGLHKFMNWKKPILTDSGGFQVMSLSSLRKVTDEGVKFRSHIDGRKHLLTPKRSIEIQHLLGSDITMIFDECISFPAVHETARMAMYRSLRWGEQSKKAFIAREGYKIFGIVQGGVYEDLRKISATELVNIGYDGYAIGGLAVGEGQEIMLKTLEHVMPYLPQNKPRYLMGVGKPEDIVSAVLKGVDMFDCVIPTRSGRNGQIFTWKGRMNIKKQQYQDSKSPIDKNCTCLACQNYTKGYLHHLFKAKEILASVLMTHHNLQFYQDLTKALRQHIEEKTLIQFAEEFLQIHNNAKPL